LVSFFLLASLVIGVIALTPGAAEAKNKTKKHHHHQTVAGTVTSTNSGGIAVQTKNDGEKQFKVTGATAVNIVDKKSGESKPGTADDVKAGEKIKIESTGDMAKIIDVHLRKHKHKTK
jgi:hypothetical protein